MTFFVAHQGYDRTLNVCFQGESETFVSVSMDVIDYGFKALVCAEVARAVEVGRGSNEYSS